MNSISLDDDRICSVNSWMYYSMYDSKNRSESSWLQSYLMFIYYYFISYYHNRHQILK